MIHNILTISNKEQLVHHLNHMHFDFYCTISVKRTQGLAAIHNVTDSLFNSFDRSSPVVITDYFYEIEKKPFSTYHIHCLIAVKDPALVLFRSKIKSASASVRFEMHQNYKAILADAEEDFSRGGWGTVKIDCNLRQHLRKFGETDIRIFDQNRKLNCIYYLTKTINEDGSCNQSYNISKKQTMKSILKGKYNEHNVTRNYRRTSRRNIDFGW